VDSCRRIHFKFKVTDISGNGQVFDVLITVLDTFPPQFINCRRLLNKAPARVRFVFIDPVALDNCHVAEMIQTAGFSIRV
jgi:hypothetical protein